MDVAQLKTARSAGRYATGRAPYKAVALLAMARLHAAGQLNPKAVDLHSIALHRAYRELWDALGYPFKSSPATPLFHLWNDGVYSGVEGSPKSLRQIAPPGSAIALSTEIRDMLEKGKLVHMVLRADYFTEQQVNALRPLLPA